MDTQSAAELKQRPSTSTILGFFGLLWFSYVVFSYVNSYRRLSHFPGPRLAAWSNLWYIRAALSKKSHLYLHEVCQKYGSDTKIVRVAPNVLVTTDTELIRRMSKVKTSYLKSNWYKAFRFSADRENLFSETDMIKHAEMRKKLTVGYSGNDNKYLEADMDKVIFTMVDLIKSKYISRGNETKPCDIGQIIQYFTLDVITALALSKSFGWLEDEDKFQYIETMEKTMPAMNFVSAVPSLLKFMTIPAVLNSALPSIKDATGMGAVKGEAHRLVAERFKAEKEKATRGDMIQSFVNSGLTQEQIADESLLQILAGSDTTATTLRVATICISSNHLVARRLREEVDNAGVPPDEVITYARALQLPYLNAVVKETLRYYPINTGLTPRMVGPEGDYYNGLYLPPYTEIGSAAWSVYRHNPVYGADAAYFRPDRWMNPDPEQLAKMEKEQELTFSYGVYKCMGERIARIELLKTLFELTRRFDFALLNPMQPLVKEECYGLMVQRGMVVRCEERELRG